MDLAWRRAGLSGFSSKFTVECSESLALRGTHAQHQGRGPRRGAFSLGVFRPTGAHRPAVPCACLDHRRVRVSFFCAAEALPVPAVVIESYIARSRQAWLKPALILTTAASGAWLAPVVMPVLPVARFISYMDHLPFKVPRSEHSHMRAILPQHFADQFGWEEMVATVNQAYSRLSPEERPGCGIFAQN